MENKIRNFYDLNAWKEAHKLVLTIYKISKLFPKEELFALTNQIQLASISITSNIAEGFGRETIKDKTHFYTIALGSLNEAYAQVITAKDLGYIKNDDWNNVEEQIIITSKILAGLIKKSKSFSSSF